MFRSLYDPSGIANFAWQRQQTAVRCLRYFRDAWTACRVMPRCRAIAESVQPRARSCAIRRRWDRFRLLQRGIRNTFATPEFPISMLTISTESRNKNQAINGKCSRTYKRQLHSLIDLVWDRVHNREKFRPTDCDFGERRVGATGAGSSRTAEQHGACRLARRRVSRHALT